MTAIVTTDGIPVVEVCDRGKLPGAPLVSVAMTTYNHAPWLDEVVQGVLMQKTDFALELVIADDCSTDGTRAMAHGYQARHPHLIRLLLPEKNLGAKQNSQSLFARCRGNYIAICEGDDVWTDPAKLRLQIELLESRSDVMLCGHRVTRGSQRGDGLNEIFPAARRPAINTLADVLAENWIPTCSMVMRKEIAQENPAWARGLPFCDWPLQVVAALRGDVGFLDAVMGFNRVHSAAVRSRQGTIRSLEIDQMFYSALQNQIPESCWTTVVLPRLAGIRLQFAEAQTQITGVTV